MKPGSHSVVWLRVGALAVSAIGLYLVFRRVDPVAFESAFRRMRLAWFVAAVLLYGLLFVPASTRWHIILRLTRTSVHPRATAEAYLVGHFFYILFFGAVGGDAARSALYARWHRIPLPNILATAPLDRALGALGLGLFAILAFCLAAVAGGLSELHDVSWKWATLWWLLVVIVLLAGGVWLVGRSGPDSFGHRFLRALLEGGKVLWSAPLAGIAGASCGLAMQIILSGVLAFNLKAVTQSTIPWFHMAWAFPVVALMGSLPITVAGLGAREGVALMLLGIYGVSSATAVAASLLTLSASLFWGLIGGLLWWSGSKAHPAPRPASPHG